MEIKKNLVRLRTFFISFFRKKKNVQTVRNIGIFLAINWVIRLIEIGITRILPPVEAIIMMFVSSLILRFIFIIIYDIRKKDFILIEELKKNESRTEDEQNSVIRKITNLEKSKKGWIIFVGLLLFDPVVMVLYYRNGYYKWNNFSNLKVFGYFVASVLACTIELALAVYSVETIIVRPVIELVNLLLK